MGRAGAGTLTIDKETTTTDTVSEAPNRAPNRTSLAFALGQFSSEIANHTKLLDRLPGQVVEQLSPRFAALETARADHETRLKALERWRWIVVGGGTVVAGIVGLVARMPSH